MKLQYDNEELIAELVVDVTQIPLNRNVYKEALHCIKEPLKRFFKESGVKNPLEEPVIRNFLPLQPSSLKSSI